MRTFRALAACVTLCAGVMQAQYASQQITGFIRDASGAVVPNAKVVAAQAETGFTRETASNEQGYYVIPNVPIGIYQVTAEASGFKRSTQTGIKVEVNGKPQI